LLNTYEEKEEAELAYMKIKGKKKLASERDDTIKIYNLFGHPSWANFYSINMFNLKELENIIKIRANGDSFDVKRHKEIINILIYVAKKFSLDIPEHWL
ncbi:hypothetical protein INF73_08180, partial [Enterobacter cloacae complex sp. P6RS]|uniref:hypothetical protein n=1 Tax=Enterobacter cloacae complex sp. P6RS TaxID=2779588 RepID=UPI001874331B